MLILPQYRKSSVLFTYNFTDYSQERFKVKVGRRDTIIYAKNRKKR